MNVPRARSVEIIQVTASLTVSGTMDVFAAAVGDRLGPRTELMPGGFDAAEPPAVVGDGGLVVAPLECAPVLAIRVVVGLQFGTFLVTNTVAQFQSTQSWRSAGG
ncbi:hypothetical protein FOZ61_003491 [Perkinsus olseni]|uniref:Uncharacterized protein n=1 Tax=Perkinsus olseni TaxID=32597 RepID=A0A7J6LPJ4_PEROL|nr:hypothetical protein FOZ61_003491 [Perkinsus olseni]KAF4666354.1 hypothetical protein FOL46_003119 [Perkinsus olseni]